MARAIPDTTGSRQPPLTATGWVSCIFVAPAICSCLSLLLAARLIPDQPNVFWLFVATGTALSLLIPPVGRYWYRTVTAVLPHTAKIAFCVSVVSLLMFVVFP